MKFLFKDKSLDKAEKIQLIISYLLQASLLVAVGFFIYNQEWLNTFLTSGIFILTLLPSLVRRSYKVHLPVEIDLVIIVLIYTALFLGEVNSYYRLLWWWDLLLHTGSGVLLGIAGFLLVYVLNREETIHVEISQEFSALFSFTFSLAIGVLWEIFEFSMDLFFGLNMQKSGLVDTMTDLIVYTLGALFIVVIGYLYSRKKERKLIDKLVHLFFKKGPSLR